MSFSKAPPLSARSTALRHWSSPAGGKAPARHLSSNVMPIARIYALILGPFGTIRGNGQPRASPQAGGLGSRGPAADQPRGAGNSLAKHVFARASPAAPDNIRGRHPLSFAH